MNIIAFVLWIVAAVLFLFFPEPGAPTRPGWVGNRSGVSLGLFFFTVGWIIELVAKSHGVHQ